MIYKMYNNDNNLRIQSLGELLEPVEESLQAQTLQKVSELWKSCFHDTKSYMQFYFQWKTDENKIVTSFEEDTITSMIHLNPYEIMLNKKGVPSYYIVGVATREDYRKRGLMRKLLQASLHQMYDENIPFAYLMPAKESIYLPFDFRTVAVQQRIRLSKSDLYHKKITDDYKCIHLDSKNQIMLKKLSEFTNDRLAQNHHVYTRRSAQYYKAFLAEMKSCNGGIIVIEKDNKICGYGAFAIEEGVIEVIDYIFDNDTDVMKQLLLENIIEQYKIEVKAEAGDFSKPTIMARIVNFTEFIAHITSKEDMTLNLQIIDPIIEANEGIYEVVWKGSNCTLKKGNAIPDFSIDIATLTSFLFGSITTKEVLELVHKEDDKGLAHKLNCMNPLCNIHINEVV